MHQRVSEVSETQSENPPADFTAVSGSPSFNFIHITSINYDQYLALNEQVQYLKQVATGKYSVPKSAGC